MARTGWGRHTVVATGSNDNTKQVSVNAWNNDLDTDGILGFAAETIASASSITPTNSFIKLSGTTSIDTIALANSSEGDLLYIITTGSVTLNNTSSPSSDGDIRLLSNANTDLSTTVPTILMRVSTFWYEYGGSPVTDGSVTFAKIQNLATMKVIGRTAGGSGVSSEVSILDEDNMATDSATSVATQQSIKAYVDSQDHNISDGEVTNAKLADMAANTIKVRNANSSGVPSDVALTNTQILIGDGTGFTAAALSGDVTMANTGAVTVGTLNQNTTGSSASCTGLSATATALATGRTLAITGEISYTSPSFDGTGNVTAAGTVADNVIDEANLKSDNGPTNDYVLTAKSSASGGLTWAAAASGSDTPWTEVHNFAGYYYDMTVQTKPGNPSANNARFYIKEIDTNNDGLFCILRKKGSETQEVKIV